MKQVCSSFLFIWDHNLSHSRRPAILACPIVAPQPRKDELVVIFTSTGEGLTGGVQWCGISTAHHSKF